jgi:hypothetical protein
VRRKLEELGTRRDLAGPRDTASDRLGTAEQTVAAPDR